MAKIYVMCPYSKTLEGQNSVTVKAWRFRMVTVYAAALVKNGNMVVSPITHCHPIAMAGKLDGSYNFWKQWNADMIAWSEEGHVLCLPGWQESEGISDEIKLFEMQDKTVRYIEREQYHEAVGGLA